MASTGNDDYLWNRLSKPIEKKIRLNSHLYFLDACVQKALIPRGFKLKWTMNLGQNSQSSEIVKPILFRTSQKLIEESLKVCKAESLTLQRNIDQQLQNLKQKYNTQIVQDQLYSMNQKHETISRKLRQTKDRKLKSLNNDRFDNKNTRPNDPNITHSDTHVSEAELRDNSNSTYDENMSYNKTNTHNTQELLEPCNSRIIPIKKDGNCFFRCMSVYLMKNEEHHFEIRQTIVKTMIENKEFYSELVDGNFEDHIRNIKLDNGHTNTWATESEIIAASQAYDIEIFVKTDIDGNINWIRNSRYETCNHGLPFITILHENNHFSLIENQPRPCKCPSAIGLPSNETMLETTTNNKSAENSSCFEVFNLSSKILTNAQIQLLSKGLKFVPSRKKVDFGKLIADIRTWERRMRLREYFFDKNEDQDLEIDPKNDKFKPKSDFTPSSGRDKWLDIYIKEVRDDIIKGLRKDFKMNITPNEEKALRELLYDDSIVIRPCDKSSGIVILDKEYYVQRVKKDLENNITYKEVDTDMTTKIENKIKKTIEQMYKAKLITKEMRAYLLPKGSRPGKVQGNPKMHKKHYPLRTIINGQKHATENMVEVVENELSENVKNLDSYIQDTTDFLNKLNTVSQPLPPGSILFCLDVKALYPSVPRKEARDACKEALENRSNHQISTDCVLQMLDLVLENNHFNFNGKHYTQTEGTAIGSHLGMNYACTYLGKWEENLFEKSTVLPKYYWRYVDDVFGIWVNGLEALKDFHKMTNSIHQNIKTELRYSSEKIEFLDVNVSLENNVIKTDLYCKDTDKHMYLEMDSCHPKNVKTAIPYGLGIRVKRICSEDTDYISRRSEIKMHLDKRGYPDSLIEDQLQKVDKLERKSLLKYKKKKQNDRVPLVITYSDGLPNIHSILRKNLKTLHRSDRMKEIFKEPSIVSFRRDKNIKDILVHRKHNLQFYGETHGCMKCGHKKCALCSHIIETPEFMDNSGKIYKIQGNINCKTINVIYYIFCSKCNKYVYVGQTGDSLYQRMSLNFSKIRTRKIDDPVAKHFCQKNHSAENLKVIGIEKVNGDRILREVKESFWIRKLKMYESPGLNTKITERH